MNNIDDYYNDELHTLEKDLYSFINKHQSIFSDIRSSIGDTSNGDINTYFKKIIESFAFLTARLKYQNDNLFNEISKKLVNVIYPEITEDTYCRGLIKCDIDNSKSNLQTYLIPKYKEVLTYDENGDDIKFSLQKDEILIPAEISHVTITDFGSQNSGPYIKIDMDIFGEIPDDTFVKFYILNNKKFFIFDSVIACLKARKCLVCDNEKNILFDSKIIYDLIENDFNAYYLLKEYITFDDSFLYFSLKFKNVKNRKISVYIPVDKDLINYDISINNIGINIFPIYNIYKKYSDPIIYDNKKIEYLIVSDAKKHDNERVSKILNIIHSDKKNYTSEIITNYFSPNKVNSFYWVSRDVKNLKYTGYDKYISFIDTGINYSKYNDSVFYAEILCTNRKISNFINIFSNFSMETDIPIKKMNLVDKLYNGENIDFAQSFFLKFLLMMNKNYFTFCSDNNDVKSKLDKLLEIFYNTYTKNTYFSDIDSLAFKSKNKRVGNQVWRGVVSGYSMDVYFKDDFIKSKILFGLVIAYIFNMSISINSFIEIGIFNKCKKLISFQLNGKVYLI